VNVACPECRSVFRVDPARVSSAGVRARCSVCGGVIMVGVGASIDEEFASPGPARVAAPVAAPVSAPVAAAPVAAPVSAPIATPVAAPARPAPFPPRPVMPPSAPPNIAQPAMGTPARGGFAIRPTMPPMPAIPSARPASAPASAPAPSGVATPMRPMPPVRPVAPPSAPAVAPSAPAPARAPINPFLANDPNAKARRLSRALISDLVTYFPQRRDEGLRDGTLKELFREEIKKSYEEYVDQVGRDFADSTTHFQEALNEILAGGQKMF
jgi:predicted Zn finger-like uncharacterized protein